ncbi:MAG: hypothetical protein Q8K98_05200 [Bacteroidota bacterium]|nr:hypothetical protein [Bacteroidota bacterium]
MHVHFNGHTTATVQKVSESELNAIMPDEDRGCFDYTWDANLQDDILTVAFTTAIFINQALTGAEASEVEAHERQHFEDFHRLARDLKESIETALENGQDHEIVNRLDWFDYDNWKAKKQRHAEAGVVDHSHCPEPITPRPA